MKASIYRLAVSRPRVTALRDAITEALRAAPGSDRPPVRFRGSRPTTAAISGAAILSAAFAIAPNGPAAAQEAADSGIEEVTVTGSRIRRQDFTANAPITTVDRSTFEETGA